MCAGVKSYQCFGTVSSVASNEVDYTVARFPPCSLFFSYLDPLFPKLNTRCFQAHTAPSVAVSCRMLPVICINLHNFHIVLAGIFVAQLEVPESCLSYKMEHSHLPSSTYGQPRPTDHLSESCSLYRMSFGIWPTFIWCTWSSQRCLSSVYMMGKPACAKARTLDTFPPHLMQRMQRRQRIWKLFSFSLLR